MKQSIIEDKFCADFQSHKSQHIWFCFSCASKNENPIHSNVIFCGLCHRQIYKKHKEHKPLQNTKYPSFEEYIYLFKDTILRKQQELITSQDQYLRFIVNQQPIINKFEDSKFKKWLIGTKFWQFANPSTANAAYKNLKIYLKTQSTYSLIAKQSSKIIDWGKLNDQNGLSIFDSMYKQAQIQKQKLSMQKMIIDLVIEALSTYNIQNKKQINKEIDIVLQNYPNEIILYLIKIYLCDLHEGNYDEWKVYLEKIKQIMPELKQSPLCLFLESHKYWQKINQSNLQELSKNTLNFVDPITGNIFILISPNQYTILLSKAIISSSNPSCILQAARGIGYLAQSKINQAVRDLKSACQLQSKQSIEMNYFWAKNKINSMDQGPEVFLKQIQKKSKHSIINVIKYLKNKKMYKEIVQCCDTLFGQQNQNTFVLIQYVKALLKVGDVKKADQIKSKIPKQKIDDSLKQNLQRKRIYSEARVACKNGQFDRSTQKCKELVIKKQSASAYYTLASSFYNQQKYEQAEQHIKKALQLKNFQKYKKLKFYTHMMKKQLEEAKKMLPEFKTLIIQPKIIQMLSQIT